MNTTLTLRCIYPIKSAFLIEHNEALSEKMFTPASDLKLDRCGLSSFPENLRGSYFRRKQQRWAVRVWYLWSLGWAGLSWRCTAERWWRRGREHKAADDTSSPGHRWSLGSSLNNKERKTWHHMRALLCLQVKLAQQTRTVLLPNLPGRFQLDSFGTNTYKCGD